jgi:hypothetical protein
VDAVVRSGGCAVGEGVEYADGKAWSHAGGDVVGGEPAEVIRIGHHDHAERELALALAERNRSQRTTGRITRRTAA